MYLFLREDEEFVIETPKSVVTITCGYGHAHVDTRNKSEK